MNQNIKRVKSSLDVKYEKSSILKKILNYFLIHPILNNLPSSSQSRIKKTHNDAKIIVENKTTHKALEVLYLGKNKENSKNLKEKLFKFIWMQTENAKAVRNRLKLTESEIEKHIRFLYSECGEKKLRLLSIASGSARSFLEVLNKVNDLDNLELEITFLDKNPFALEYSKGLYASEKFANKKYSFNWVEGTANGYLRGLDEKQDYHLVEMVGLMDYFDDEKAMETTSSVYRHLTKKGCFITANIIPNSEQPFVTNVVGWRMIYRQPESFIHLIEQAEFKACNIQGMVEPMNIHVVVKAVKD